MHRLGLTYVYAKLYTQKRERERENGQLPKFDFELHIYSHVKKINKLLQKKIFVKLRISNN